MARAKEIIRYHLLHLPHEFYLILKLGCGQIKPHGIQVVITRLHLPMWFDNIRVHGDKIQHLLCFIVNHIHLRLCLLFVILCFSLLDLKGPCFFVASPCAMNWPGDWTSPLAIGAPRGGDGGRLTVFGVKKGTCHSSIWELAEGLINSCGDGVVIIESIFWENWVGPKVVVVIGVSMVLEPSKREARRDWAVAIGVKVRGGVKIDGLVWVNWEKLPTNLVVGVEKVGLTLVVMGIVGMVEDIKYWEVRGVNVTYWLDIGGAPLVTSCSLTSNC